MRIFLGPVLSAPSFSQRPFLFCAQPHGSPCKDMKFEHHIRCVSAARLHRRLFLRQITRLLRPVEADSEGHFEVQNIANGDYRSVVEVASRHAETNRR